MSRITAVTHRHDSLLVSVTTTITPNQSRELDAYCKARGFSKSEVLRGLIEAELVRVSEQPPVVLPREPPDWDHRTVGKPDFFKPTS